MKTLFRSPSARCGRFHTVADAVGAGGAVQRFEERVKEFLPPLEQVLAEPRVPLAGRGKALVVLCLHLLEQELLCFVRRQLQVDEAQQSWVG